MLQFYNSLSRTKETLHTLEKDHARMYVCGPTVYARPHIGNARSAVVYDVLFRVLQATYPRVTYVRNITDVDDKINAAAVERGITIQALTEEVTQQFHDDMGALNVLRPTVEPRATEHIAQMIAMIEQLIAKGHAYAAEGHVLFSVGSYGEYGKLSGRSRDEMIAGARVEVAPYKKDPADFVLWKPAAATDDASSKFDSPWGVGRPGWHIECSAMSATHVGATFDIHGGGADLKFPHHENEIAQSRCADENCEFARMWVHNGFLTVNGEKMSKSLENFITVHDLLSRGVKGEVIRLALLSSKYNEPLDWSEKLLSDCEKVMDRLYRAAGGVQDSGFRIQDLKFFAALCDDLNTPLALSLLQQMDGDEMVCAAQFLGLLQQDPQSWFKGTAGGEAEIEAQIVARAAAKKAKNWAEADRIRDALKAQGILLEDRPDGTTDWRRA